MYGCLAAINVLLNAYLFIRYYFNNVVLLPYLDNLPLDRRCMFFFQQDGAPPHFGRNVRQLLQCPRHWIDLRGPIKWPHRSPDLKLLDFFLWRHLKSSVYNNRPQTLIGLQNNISRACVEISPAKFRNVRRSFCHRVQLYRLQEGSQFEHLR